jgi:hypothetical protein
MAKCLHHQFGRRGLVVFEDKPSRGSEIGSKVENLPYIIEKVGAQFVLSGVSATETDLLAALVVSQFELEPSRNALVSYMLGGKHGGPAWPFW